MSKTKTKFLFLILLILSLCFSAVLFIGKPVKANAAADTHTHDGVSFEAWSNTASLPQSGNYYLTADVALEGHSIPETVNLCLNGHDVAIDSELTVEREITFNFYDCQDSGVFSQTQKNGAAVIGLKERAVFNVYGGIIDGLGINRCIYVPVNGKLNIYGGVIRNGVASYGGGVYCRGTFAMYGGKIQDNIAKADESVNNAGGGGVFVGVYGTLAMYGGSITNNKAVNNEGYDSLGGGICVEGYTGYNYSEIHLYGGEISGNSADLGGGIYLYKAFLYVGAQTEDFNVTQTPIIKNNTATKDGGGIASFHDAYIDIKNTLLEGNTANTGRGGGIYSLYSFYLDNSTVRNNKSGGEYLSGGIYGTAIVSGVVTIEGNATMDGKSANLCGGATLHKSQSLSLDSRIGINYTFLMSVQKEEATILAADASAYQDVFFSDDELCSVYLAEDDSLKLGYIHRDHVWADTYSRNEEEHWYECLCEYENCQMLTRLSGNQYKKGYGTHDLASCMVCDPNLHYHSVCAEETCTHGGAAHDSSVRYIALTMENYDEVLELTTNVFDDKIYTFPSGNYYLAENVTIPTGYYLNTGAGGTVNLCLAGYSLSVNSNSTFTPYAIDVNQSATFTICDCSAEGTGKIVSNSMGEVIQVGEQCTLNVYGGTLQLLSSSATNAYGIYCSANDGSLNFYRGKISVRSAGHIVAVSFQGGALVYALTTELESTDLAASVADFNVWAKALNGFTLISDEDYSFNVLEISDNAYTSINLSEHTGTATFNTVTAHGGYICLGDASNAVIANEGWGAVTKTVNAKQYVTIEHIEHSGTDDGNCLTEERCSCGTLVIEAKDEHDFGDTDICSNCNAVKISEKTFPNTNFRNWIIANIAGTDDEILLVDELAAVTAINLVGVNAQKLTGVELFPNLTEIKCDIHIIWYTMSFDLTAYGIDIGKVTVESGAVIGDLNGNSVLLIEEGATTVIGTCALFEGGTPIALTLNIPEPHTHKYEYEFATSGFIVTPATCITGTIYYKSCECGLTNDETFENDDRDFENHKGTNDKLVSNNAGKHNILWTCCNAVVSENVACTPAFADDSCLTAEICICGYVIKEAATEHDFSEEYLFDIEGHWHKCENCAATDTKALHDYGADDKCICGAEKPIPTYTVTVENGSVNDGNTSIVVNEKDSVTVTADDAPDGKRFKGWEVNGEIVSTEESYTFTVTADTTVTAVYEKKSKKGGCSCAVGVGSSAVAITVGLAVFFVGRKRRKA